MNALPIQTINQSSTDEALHNDDAHIRSSQLAVIQRLQSDPLAAKTTVRASGHVDQGLSCRVTQGKFSVLMDLGPAMGGQASAPSPGFYARSGIVGCLAIATKMTAVREGLSINCVNVHVDTDFDDLALFGLGDNAAGPLETRVTIDIESDEDHRTMQDLVERVLAMDPWFLALRDEQRTATHINIVPSS